MTSIMERPASAHPAVTSTQMREVDRIMTDDLGIALPQMMELAGAALARVALNAFAPRTVTVLAGAGGNGGGGLVAARYLANAGVEVHAVLARPDTAPVTARQRVTAERLGITFTTAPVASDLVIDALIGTSLRGDPSGITAELIAWSSTRTAVALDVPSGLHPDTGRVGNPCVAAAATVTLAAPKHGLLATPDRVGDLYVADVGVPPVAFERAEAPPHQPFGGESVVRVVS